MSRSGEGTSEVGGGGGKSKSKRAAAPNQREGEAMQRAQRREGVGGGHEGDEEGGDKGDAEGHHPGACASLFLGVHFRVGRERAAISGRRERRACIAAFHQRTRRGAMSFLL